MKTIFLPSCPIMVDVTLLFAAPRNCNDAHVACKNLFTCMSTCPDIRYRVPIAFAYVSDRGFGARADTQALAPVNACMQDSAAWNNAMKRAGPHQYNALRDAVMCGETWTVEDVTPKSTAK